MQVPYPAITGFSPTTVHAGDTLTITGTNFDPNPANMDVRFNFYDEVIPLTATTTTISVKVPTGTDLGLVDLGVYPKNATSFHAAEQLRIIQELTLQKIDWVYDDGYKELTGTGASYTYENSTPDKPGYFKAIGTLNVPQTIIYGMPNHSAVAQFSTSFSANQAWPSIVDSELSFAYQGTYGLKSVVSGLPQGGAATCNMSLTLTQKDLIGDTMKMELNAAAAPKFSDGTTTFVKTNLYKLNVAREHFYWKVMSGYPYDTYMHAIATYSYH